MLSWADDDSTELPEIPWNKKTVIIKFDCFDFTKEINTLDRSTELYLNNLWNYYRIQTVINHNNEKFEKRQDKLMDEGTQIFLEYYWKDQVVRAKAASKNKN